MSQFIAVNLAQAKYRLCQFHTWPGVKYVKSYLAVTRLEMAKCKSEREKPIKTRKVRCSVGNVGQWLTEFTESTI